MRAVGETGRAQEVGIPLSQEAADYIENPAQGMGPAGKGGGFARFEQGTFRNTHLNQVIKTVVEHDLGIKDHDHEDAGKHFEHFFVQVEINRSRGLGVGSLKIEYYLVVLPPHGAGDFVRTHAHAVVTHVIFEINLVFGDSIYYELCHGAVISVQQLIHGRTKHIITKTRSHFYTAFRRRPAGGDNRVKIAAVPVWKAAVMEDQVEYVLLQYIFFEYLDRWYNNAFFIDLPGVGRKAARHLAAYIRHMSEHGCPV